MASYQADRAFSEYIHQHLALPLYAKVGWRVVSLDEADAQDFDMGKGIDRVVWDGRRMCTLQERFRERKYAAYSDFTIRYRRDRSPYAGRRLSEFFKLRADYFAYGIANGSKRRPESCTAFLKFALIDLKALYRHIEAGQIRIVEDGSRTCRMDEGVLICPVQYNRDGSSSFVPFDVPLLWHRWGRAVVVMQEGFLG